MTPPTSPGNDTPSASPRTDTSGLARTLVAMLAVGGLTWLALEGVRKLPGNSDSSPTVEVEAPSTFNAEEWADRTLKAMDQRSVIAQRDLQDAFARHPGRVTFNDPLDIHETPPPPDLDAELKAIDAELKAMDPERFRIATRAMERDPSLKQVAHFVRLNFMIMHWMDSPHAQGSAGLRAQLDMIAEYFPLTLPNGGSCTLMLEVLPNGMKQDPEMMTGFMIQHWGLWDGETGDRTGNVWKYKLLKYDLDPERRSQVERLADVR